MNVYRCHRCSTRHVADERPAECALCGYPELGESKLEGLASTPRTILPKRLRSSEPHHGPAGGHTLPLASFETGYIQEMFREQDERCPLCGGVMRFEQGLSVDHKKPRSLGGRNDRANKQLTHAACNHRKGNGVSHA